LVGKRVLFLKEELSSDNTFLIISNDNVFMWIGNKSTPSDQVKASDIFQTIKHEEKKGDKFNLKIEYEGNESKELLTKSNSEVQTKSNNEVTLSKMMSMQLLILEKNLKTKSQKSSWKKKREKWVINLLDSNSFQDIANYVAELDGSLSNSSQNKEWRKIRNEWKKKTENINNLDEIVWLLKELEDSIGSNFKEPSWEKINQVRWMKAISFVVTFSSSSKSDNEKAKEIILEAIFQGIDLFNSGQVDLCAKLYQMATEISLNYCTGDSKLILTKSLNDCTSKLNPVDRAWILRTGMDNVVKILQK